VAAVLLLLFLSDLGRVWAAATWCGSGLTGAEAGVRGVTWSKRGTVDAPRCGHGRFLLVCLLELLLAGAWAAAAGAPHGVHAVLVRDSKAPPVEAVPAGGQPDWPSAG
jgi:hypothetical protein